MSAHLSELCCKSDVEAIVAHLRQVTHLDDPNSDSSPSSDGARRGGIWGHQDADGRTAFHWAVAMKNFELARTLAHAPYNSPVLTEDEELLTPFAVACAVAAPLDFLKKLLEMSAEELPAYCAWKATYGPASMLGNAQTAAPSELRAQSSGESGVDARRTSLKPGLALPAEVTPESCTTTIVNAGDVSGTSPFLLAAGRGYLVIVRFLMESGAVLTQMNNRGQTVLHRAVNRGNPELVEYLVSVSEKQNGKDTAAHRRFMDMQDFHGDSALFYASLDNNEDLGRYLLRHGADRELRNKDGKNFWEL